LSLRFGSKEATWPEYRSVSRPRRAGFARNCTKRADALRTGGVRLRVGRVGASSGDAPEETRAGRFWEGSDRPTDLVFALGEEEELGRILPTYPELVLNGRGSVKDEGRSLRERSDRPTDLVFALGEEEELT
jgi:hypothetical protein